MKKLIILLSFFQCFILFFTSILYSAQLEGIVTEIKDGDTIIVSRGGASMVLMLDGIDAPEKGQDFGKEAIQYLDNNLLNKKIKFKKKNSGEINKYLADVYYLSGTMRFANQDLVKKGLAWSNSSRFKVYENLARKKNIGIWSLPNPVSPSEFRRSVNEKKMKVARKKVREVNEQYRATQIPDEEESKEKQEEPGNGRDGTAQKSQGEYLLDLLEVQNAALELSKKYEKMNLEADGAN